MSELSAVQWSLFIIGWLISDGIALSIAVPCLGVLVRYRVNYTPKNIYLSVEHDERESETAERPSIGSSYFAMFKRVYQLEGFSGLYKGFMPQLIVVILTSLVGILFIPGIRKGVFVRPYDPLATNIILSIVFRLLTTIAFLPIMILTYRCISTPYKLPYWNWKAWEILLSPNERAQLWKLYTIAGLIPAQVLSVAVSHFTFGIARQLLFSQAAKHQVSIVFPYLIYVTLAILTSAILTPLEVIVARLCVQVEVPDETLEFQYYNRETKVIQLRTEEQPYTGLLMCYKTIIKEEGWRVLYRAWWIGLFGALLTVSAAMVAPGRR